MNIGMVLLGLVLFEQVLQLYTVGTRKGYFHHISRTGILVRVTFAAAFFVVCLPYVQHAEAVLFLAGVLSQSVSIVIRHGANNYIVLARVRYAINLADIYLVAGVLLLVSKLFTTAPA